MAYNNYDGNYGQPHPQHYHQPQYGQTSPPPAQSPYYPPNQTTNYGGYPPPPDQQTYGHQSPAYYPPQQHPLQYSHQQPIPPTAEYSPMYPLPPDQRPPTSGYNHPQQQSADNYSNYDGAPPATNFNNENQSLNNTQNAAHHPDYHTTNSPAAGSLGHGGGAGGGGGGDQNSHANSTNGATLRAARDTPVIADSERVTDAMRREKAREYSAALIKKLEANNVMIPSAKRVLLEADGLQRGHTPKDDQTHQNDFDKEHMQDITEAAGLNADERNDAHADLFDGVRLEEYRVMFNMCDSVTKIGKKEFGPGIMYYFEFVKFLAFLTFILAVLQVSLWGKYVANDSPPFSNRNTTDHGYRYFIGDFMITAYDGEVWSAWYGLSITAIVFTFLASPIYFLLMHVFVKSIESEEEGAEKIIRYDADTCEVDVTCHYRTRGDLIIRRLLAVLFLLGILAIQVVISYFLTKNQESASFGISMAISIIATTLSALFKFIAPMFTEFMMLSSFDWWKRSHALSILSIRMGSLIAVFAAKDYAASADKNCTYDIIGEQLISLFLVEIFLSPIIEIISAVMWRRYANYIAFRLKSRLGDQDNLYPWDLADYYRNILYRHFLTMMAMVVVPMIAALAFVGYVLQYWVDKFLLYKICGRPRRVAGSQKTYLTIMLAFVALCALLTPYAGTMFMLSGITRDKSPLCTFP